jgi:hypothetical protein
MNNLLPLPIPSAEHPIRAMAPVLIVPPLFKYFGHKDPNKPLENSCLKVLDKLSLRVTPANQFNNPFEFSPVVRPSATADQIINKLQTDSSLFEQHRQAFPGCRSFADFQKQLRDNNGEVARLLRINTAALVHDFQDKLPQMISEQFGVICLSPRPTQPLMWAHYSSAHEGLMIGFISDCPLFKGKGFFKVKYLSRRAIYDPSKPGEGSRQAKQFLRRKSPDWKYEQEFRLIVELKFTQSASTHAGSMLRLLPIDPSWISSVTFGIRCPYTLRAEVARMLAESHLKHVRPFEIRMHREKFDLARHELELSEITGRL